MCGSVAWSARSTGAFALLAVTLLTLTGCGHGQPDQPKNQTATTAKTGQHHSSYATLQLNTTNCLVALEATITHKPNGDCKGVAHCMLNRNCKSDVLLADMIAAHDALAAQMPTVVLWSGIDVWVYPDYASERRAGFWIGRFTQETKAEGQRMPLLSDQAAAIWAGNSFSDHTNEREKGKDLWPGPGVRWTIREYPLWSLRNGDKYRWGFTETKRRKMYAEYVEGEPDPLTTDARKLWDSEFASRYGLSAEGDRKWNAEHAALFDWPGKQPAKPGEPKKRLIDFGPMNQLDVLGAEGFLKSWPFGKPRR